MKAPRILALAVLFAAGATAAALAADRIVLLDGMRCLSEDSPRHEGETHACYFFPGKVGRHDYSTRNARGGQVITEMGPRCKEIEILGEDDHAQGGEDGVVLKRVSVLCEG